MTHSGTTWSSEAKWLSACCWVPKNTVWPFAWHKVIWCDHNFSMLIQAYQKHKLVKNVEDLAGRLVQRAQQGDAARGQLGQVLNNLMKR